MKNHLRGNTVFLLALIFFSEYGFSENLFDFGENISGSKFKIFDATQYKNKPDLSAYGIETLKIIYGHFLWPDKKITQEVPSDSFIVESINKFSPEKYEYLNLDIEHWKLNVQGEELENNLDKYIKVISLAKQQHPESKIGYYSMIPIRNYWHSLEEGENYEIWENLNKNLGKLGEEVDVIFPSLYTFYKNKEGWVKYAVAQIKAARLYDKEVIVFIWPQYHESNMFFGLDYIDKEFWSLQLEIAYKHADGVVIWGGWDFENKGPAVWDESHEWRQATKIFINNIENSQ